ncbi:MAG TPA: aryl-sulfate sulfotransferase [Acidobacteriaceae bacterium]|nr:aryl-sulfate sulfotransferase [Acidobacteriaceae bacterium]
MSNQGAAQSLAVSVAPTGGFKSSVTISLSGLPAGVTATPSTANITPGQVTQFMLSASGASTTGTPSITITGTSGTKTHTTTASLTIAPAISNASLSNASYDFGGNLVGSTLTKSVVTITNTGTTDVTLSPTLSGDASYAIVPAQSCTSSLASGVSCMETISYTPTAASGSTPQTATLNLGLGNVPAGTAQTVALTGVSATLPQGTVTATNNPQVALYTMTLPYPGSVTVNFGTDTTYGTQTWTRSTSTPGGTVSIFVAGMLPNTEYHMQAAVQLANGVTATDADHTFTAGAPLLTPAITTTTTTTTTGMTPQPGVEEVTLISGAKGIVVTDLQGNTLWSYVLQDALGIEEIDGVKLLPNGHFLITIGEGSAYSLTSPTSPAGSIVAIREIDLAGNIVREISVADLNDELQAAGYNITLQQFHHDITPLPNGHWLVLSNTMKSFSSVAGESGPQNVLGDVIIDLNKNLQPVWVWNEFDHLDINHHPMGWPDWTHTNAVIYSPSDHNIIVSMRHQNWVVKVDYNDGAGSGDVLWRLGEGGDFTLVGGTDPTDWNYAQHYPSLFSQNSSGIFSLGMMDNGNDRIFPDGGLCGTGSEPACYSTIPVFQIDEGAKTATLTFHQVLSPSLYNSFGGNTEQLANGDIEYDLCGVGSNSDIFEVTPDPANPQTVWHMHLASNNAYRGYRIPSLYPGVQW